MDKARQRDSLIDLDAGYRTRVQEEGTGPALVLIHGTPLDTRAWDPLVPLLHDRRRVVRYDARGHGVARSTPIPGSYGPLGDDVAALLDELDVHQAHVVGHSWGGEIAQRFALDHPDRLSRLSLLCTRSSPFPAFRSSGARTILRHLLLHAGHRDLDDLPRCSNRARCRASRT